MSIAPLSASSAAAQLALLLQPDAGLAAKLQIGQIVQGQVLRHFEGSRYLVRLLGQDAVVESATPLRPNDVLRGRVTALKDRIELERIDAGKTESSDPGKQGGEEGRPGAAGGGRAAEIIEELFQRYRGTLAREDTAELERAVRRSRRPERVALAGLVLSKLGLPVERELLESVSLAIEGRFGGLAPLGDPDLELALTPAAPAAPVEGGAAALGEAISAHCSAEGKDAPRAAWPPSQWVLNAQGGGSVAHRVGMLPLHLEGNDLRVEYALFEEGDGEAQRAGALRHRKAVLMLELESLGRVELRAVTAGEHVRVALATESRERTNALLRHGEALENAFDAAGWKVDEIAYETRAPEAPGGVVGAAVEHIVAPGSVSRLV